MKIRNIFCYILVLCLLVPTITLPTKALYPQPRIELDEYSTTITDITKVYVEGTVSKARGQSISLRDSSFNIIAVENMKDTGKKESFSIKIPAVYI